MISELLQFATRNESFTTEAQSGRRDLIRRLHLQVLCGANSQPRVFPTSVLLRGTSGSSSPGVPGCRREH